MKRKVELAFDRDIKRNKRIGTFQVLLGILTFFLSCGLLLMRGPKIDFAIVLILAVFMVVTGINTKKQ